MDLTFEQLPKAVSQILQSLERIEHLLSPNEGSNFTTNNDGQILKVYEAAKFLDITSSTIYKHTFRREIPHVKKGKRLYFVKSELVDWVKSGRVKTSYEIEQEALSYIIKSAKRKMK